MATSTKLAVLINNLMDSEYDEEVFNLIRKIKVKRRKAKILKMLLYSFIKGKKTIRYWTLPKSQEWWYDIANVMSDESWKNNFRISKNTFNYLCFRMHALQRKDTTFRKCVPLNKRIAIALYTLSSSAEYRTVGNLFGVSKSSVCEMTIEFCKYLVKLLKGEFICFPTTHDSVSSVINGFEEEWNFPQCVGAIDGCHIAIKPPKEHATDYYNYKGFHSINLLAVVDYAYRFLYINVGSPGRNNDAHIFSKSGLKQLLTKHEIYQDLSKLICNTLVPVCLIGDSAFPLMPTLQKPYFDSMNISEVQKYYNFRLSRARRVVENSFG